MMSWFLQKGCSYEKEVPQALRRNNGNKTATAKQLGIDKSTLFRKMKTFDIKPKSYPE